MIAISILQYTFHLTLYYFPDYVKFEVDLGGKNPLSFHRLFPSFVTVTSQRDPSLFMRQRGLMFHPDVELELRSEIFAY